MTVQTLTTVELTDATDGSKLTVDPRTDIGSSETQRWHISHDSHSGVYATDDDLREFAHAILALIGED